MKTNLKCPSCGGEYFAFKVEERISEKDWADGYYPISTFICIECNEEFERDKK